MPAEDLSSVRVGRGQLPASASTRCFPAAARPDHAGGALWSPAVQRQLLLPLALPHLGMLPTVLVWGCFFVQDCAFRRNRCTSSTAQTGLAGARAAESSPCRRPRRSLQLRAGERGRRDAAGRLLPAGEPGVAQAPREGRAGVPPSRCGPARSPADDERVVPASLNTSFTCATRKSIS